ncbi:toxin YdaT family protein [Pectobacterium polaris]|uniref:toxin YdaT family protein n=1 Tax=Pectobacterium polaris TaxID=2042057 RepID=UPI000B161368|nr:toxin YdaT family protein [Pectobacterium polaris]ASY77971.1 tRNA-(guanine-N1)-methyltransferase [Pectobacterium polaris]
MDRLKAEVENWAVKDGQEQVAIEITKQFFLLGGNDSIRLRRIENNGVADCKAIYNNRQQIFRWLRSDSRASQAKSEALRPAIIAALPIERRVRIEGDEESYLISILLREISAALIAIVLKDREVALRVRAAQKSFDVILRYIEKT